MEVHHHAHSAQKEKNFKHYLFEFLMLFLAVSAGFWQNIRLSIKLKRQGKTIHPIIGE